MVETTTKNYGWTKPELTKSASTWGGFLNGDLDSIDALVFANQQGIVPVGSIAMFGGATAPANWLICDGSSLDTTAYAGLFAILQYTYGGSGANFNLPNLQQKFPMGGATPGAAGGEATHTLVTAELPTVTPTATQAAHTHTATQAAHTHTDSGHGHSASASQAAHSHSLSNQVLTPSAGGNAGAAAGWGFTTVTTDAQAPAVSVSVAAGAANLTAATPAITLSAPVAPAITVAPFGGGTPHNNLPPYLTVNFIIRYQ